MNIKKILILLIFLTIGLGIFSCNRNEARRSGAETEPVTITFWHSMANDAGIAFETFVREFNAGPGAEMNITVESIFQGQYAEATAKLRPLLQARQVNALPDVMQFDATGIVDYLNTEYALTVDQAMALDSDFDTGIILEAPLKAWNYGGRQLGLPVSASTTIMYYNKSILDAAGINSPPTTFEEIIETSRRLPTVNENNQRLTAFAQQPNTPLLANWVGQIPGRDGVNTSYVVDNRNGRDGNAEKLAADTDGNLLTFLRAWKTMYDAGAVLDVTDSFLNNMFLTQQIVFMTGSTSLLASLISQIDGRFELGTGFFPRINEDSNFGATVSGSALFMFDKGNSNGTRAAWEFVKFMTSSEIQARFAAETGYMPVNILSLQESTYVEHLLRYPQAATGSMQLSITSPDMMGVIVGPSRNFYFEIVNQVSMMLTSGSSPEETVSSMSRALNLLLDDYAEANR